MLIVMAGPPGAGKSTVAEATARLLGCAVVSVDPIEAAMWRAGVDRAQPTGYAAYVVAESLAQEQLHLGHDVIVDAVNDVEPARWQWRELARRTGVELLFVEVVVSDAGEHRRRLEARRRDIEGFPEPAWPAVEARLAAFAEWDEDRLRLDFLADPAVNADAVVSALEQQ